MELLLHLPGRPEGALDAIHTPRSRVHTRPKRRAPATCRPASGRPLGADNRLNTAARRATSRLTIAVRSGRVGSVHILAIWSEKQAERRRSGAIILAAMVVLAAVAFGVTTAVRDSGGAPNRIAVRSTPQPGEASPGRRPAAARPAAPAAVAATLAEGATRAATRRTLVFRGAPRGGGSPEPTTPIRRARPPRPRPTPSTPPSTGPTPGNPNPGNPTARGIRPRGIRRRAAGGRPPRRRPWSSRPPSSSRRRPRTPAPAATPGTATTTATTARRPRTPGHHHERDHGHHQGQGRDGR